MREVHMSRGLLTLVLHFSHHYELRYILIHYNKSILACTITKVFLLVFVML